MIFRELRPAFSLVVLFTLLIGLILPGIFTGAMQAVLPWQANGSLVRQDGQVIGSALIGQNFVGVQYFIPRPSALSPAPYTQATSGASNLAPTSRALLASVQQRVTAYVQAYGPGPVPADAVTASGSGLDPDISLENALRQAPAVAKARHLPAGTVIALVQAMAHHAFLGMIGTDHVNVLKLNLALDQRPVS
ncbi:potassium-transporting ATPase subunit KdpC [Acidocella sp. KAb 2-4]|uniref:potassium-transporting ATPase subunit KdpC n=1 Tax=Acidocella sp. KAb 2-4 TaxID=2885158 RepID=UPI0021032195|nr:potassium-transporting ATPase subunit KdpC [Acidocella sp. KAb 2-4]